MAAPDIAPAIAIVSAHEPIMFTSSMPPFCKMCSAASNWLRAHSSRQTLNPSVASASVLDMSTHKTAVATLLGRPTLALRYLLLNVDLYALYLDSTLSALRVFHRDPGLHQPREAGRTFGQCTFVHTGVRGVSPVFQVTGLYRSQTWRARRLWWAI